MKDPTQNDLNEVEQILSQLPLTEPDEAFDQSVIAAIAHGASVRAVGEVPRDSNISSIPVHKYQPGWLALAASSLACCLLGVWVGSTIVQRGAEPIAQSELMNRKTDPVQLVRPEAASSSSDVTSQSGPVEQTEPRLNPIRLRDEGLFLVNGTTPVRRYISTSTQTITSQDPVSGKSSTQSTPIQRVILTPARPW